MEEDILSEIENLGEKQKNNEIIEIDENEEIATTQYDVVKEVKSNNKSSKNNKKLTRKQKIIIIAVCSALLVLIIVLLLLYFFVFKKDDDTDNKKPDEPVVIVEKDNYKYENGKLIFIDEQKNELGSYECKNKDEKLCFVANFSQEDDFDIAKKVYEDGTLISDRSDILENNYVFVYDNTKEKDGKLILYNINKKKNEDEYDLVKELEENKVIVKQDDKYGILTFSKDNYEEELKIKYDYLGYIPDADYLVSAKNNNYKLIDFEGEDVSESVPGKIKNYDKDNISVSVNGKYYVYDYNGNKRIEKTYDYIKFASTYFIGADDKKLYIYDNEGFIMNGEGIRITSNEYNTKLIFNEDLRQIGKEEAFNANLNGTTLRIEYDEDYVNVNINEGKFNKTLGYINYFAGKLYFYSDEEKTKLLGTYACSYANSVSATNEELENCFIAKESNLFKASDNTIGNGYLPIYNNRYVFIADTKSPNTNDNIILYDLEGKKKLATYKEVDAGFHKIADKVNFIDTAGNITIAKNSNNSYGVINIGKSSVKGIIAFKDSDTGATNDTISTLGDNILIKRSDKTYHLYDQKGNEITKNINTTNEIVDYQGTYLTVKNGSNYMIYDKNGSLVKTKEDFVYIKLYEKFYVSVNKDNMINVYLYNGITPINNEDGNNKAVNTSDYKKSYEIEFDAGSYRLLILDSEGKYSNSYLLNLAGE